MADEADVPELVDIQEAPAQPVSVHADEDDLDNDDEDVENFAEPCVCLLCDSVQTSARLVLEHCCAAHGFDFLRLRKEKGLDFYASMCVLNFLRSQPDSSSASDRVAALNAELTKHVAKQSSALTNGQFLQPKNPEDPILYSFEDDEEEENDDGALAPVATFGDDVKLDAPARDSSSSSSQQQLISRYEAEIAALRAQMAQMTEVMHRVALGGPDARADSSSDSESGSDNDDESDEKKPSFASPSAPGKKKDQGYFDGYSEMGIHDEMLRDTVRTLAYRDFMYNNCALFANKVVLDIGCGTGILSLFAAEAGARRVIGIDRAAIVDKAAVIVKANKKDDVITLVKGRVEELPELPEKKVDIIVSEWMGYLLLYESMLSTVLYARDKWLAPGGVVHPSRARLFLSAMDLDSFRSEQRTFWMNVYGFDMSSMLQPWPDAVICGNRREPLVEVIPADNLCTTAQCIQDIDIMTVTDAQLDFASPFELVVSRPTGSLGALVLYFDTSFEAGCVQPHIVLDTSPHNTPTHWKQTLLFLNNPLTVQPGDRVHGEIRLVRPKAQPRGYDVVVTIALNGEKSTVQMFEMH